MKAATRTNGTLQGPETIQGLGDDVFMVGGGIAAVVRLPGLVNTMAIGFNDKAWSAGWYGPIL